MQLLVRMVERDLQRHNSIRNAIFQRCNAQGYRLQHTTVEKLQSKHPLKIITTTGQISDFNSHKNAFEECQFISVVCSCGFCSLNFPGVTLTTRASQTQRQLMQEHGRSWHVYYMLHIPVPKLITINSIMSFNFAQ